MSRRTTSHRRTVLAASCAFALAACAGPDRGLPMPPAPIAESAPTTWRDLMREVGERHELVQRMLVRGEATDLRQVADAAGAMAERIRLGYGAHEDRAIPGFAKKALDAESWLMQVALEARQAHGELAREQFSGGARHCSSCHDCLKRGR